MFTFCAAALLHTALLHTALLHTALLAADPKVERVVSINQPNGWQLDVHDDGSAILRFGAEAGSYTAPAGTFDAETVRKTLLALPSATRDETLNRQHFVYWFEAERKPAPEKEPPMHYSQAEAVIVPLFEKAASAGKVNESPRGKQLLAEKPFKLPPEATRRNVYTLHTPNAWMLSIANDGSAQLVFGDGGGPFSHSAPAGTFRLDEVRKTLDVLTFDPQGSGSTHFVVWREAERKSPSDGPPPRYTRDEAALVPLFEKASKASGETAGNRLIKSLGGDRPPFGLAK